MNKLFVYCLLSALSVSAHEDHLVLNVAKVADLANNLIDSYNEDAGQSALVFPFSSDKRETIDYFPLTYHSDAGVSMRSMTAPSVSASQTLLQSVLSEKGYQRSQLIQSLEDVLRNGSPESESNRLADNYAMQLFGKPSIEIPWGFKYEGHHLSLNFTFIDGKVRGTPLFLGANPAEVKSGPQTGLHVLKQQQDDAWQLRNMLTQEQEKIAVQTTGHIKRIPRGHLPPINKFEGLPASDMTKEQQTLLRCIFESYAETLHLTLFNLEMAKFDATDPALIHFLWHDNGHPEQRHYYRIHAPEILIEFNLLDGNHIHSLWRNPKQDFGKDLLRDHLQKEHR